MDGLAQGPALEAHAVDGQDTVPHMDGTSPEERTQSTREVQMPRASECVGPAFKYRTEAPRHRPGCPQLGRRKDRRKSTFRYSQYSRDRGASWGPVSEVRREGMREEGERKREVGDSSHPQNVCRTILPQIPGFITVGSKSPSSSFFVLRQVL